MEILIAAIFGLIIGSFLTVCVYRIPYGRPKGPPSLDDDESDLTDGPEPSEPSGEEAVSGDGQATDRGLSIVNPARSICPECGNQLKWWHNIPLFSWLVLRGRCGYCGKAIPGRYPLIEALSAAFCVLSLITYGATPAAFVVYAFCCALIVISFIDIDYYIIPDVISLPGMALGLLLGLVNGFTGFFSLPLAPNFWWSLAGLAFGGGILLLISEIYYRFRRRVGLGMGDVKLLAMTGSFFGVEAAFYTMFAGSAIGALLGILMILFLGRKITHQLPFGPYLALGTILYLFTPESAVRFLGESVFYFSQYFFTFIGALIDVARV